MEKIRFDNEWDELCPIYFKQENIFEQIGTGVLINIDKKVYLLTAAHVIDNLYFENNSSLVIPTINGFNEISGTLYHKHSTKAERNNDHIDFSFYILSKEMVDVLHKDFVPLSSNQICFEEDYFLNIKFADTKLKRKEIPKLIKNIYSGNTILSSTDVDKMNEIICDITITFAGYPNTKSKNKENICRSEIVYYHGKKVRETEYNAHGYTLKTNVLSEFGKLGSMNKEFEHYNPPQPNGISGGGIYRIIKTNNGFDRLLIGIGHTYISKKHLFVGTSISFCMKAICNVVYR